MKVGVCGIACEICPRMVKGTCPKGDAGCVPMENPFCEIASCAFRKGITHCFSCDEFPCEHTEKGPVAYGYCQYLAGIDP